MTTVLNGYVTRHIDIGTDLCLLISRTVWSADRPDHTCLGSEGHVRIMGIYAKTRVNIRQSIGNTVEQNKFNHNLYLYSTFQFGTMPEYLGHCDLNI